jgi:hypothetical protein
MVSVRCPQFLQFSLSQIEIAVNSPTEGCNAREVDSIEDTATARQTRTPCACAREEEELGGGNGHHVIGHKGTAISVDEFGHLWSQIAVTRTASVISKMLSSTTHTPTGRLAMPKTRRVDVLSAPNTSTITPMPHPRPSDAHGTPES